MLDISSTGMYRFIKVYWFMAIKTLTKKATNSWRTDWHNEINQNPHSKMEYGKLNYQHRKHQ